MCGVGFGFFFFFFPSLPFSPVQLERRHAVWYVTRTLHESFQGCCTAQAVGNTTMMPVLRSAPHHSSALAGSAQTVRCAKPAGTFEKKPGHSTIKNRRGCFTFGQHLDTFADFSKRLPFRQPGEDSKMLVCDACDKGYHTFCLQPVMDSVPPDSWKCKVSSILYVLLKISSKSCILKISD